MGTNQTEMWCGKLVLEPRTLQPVKGQYVFRYHASRVPHASYSIVLIIQYAISLPFTACRLCDLSKPIVRDTMDHVQFNPDAFNVSEAAKKARASSRIEELAQPIRRGS